MQTFIASTRTEKLVKIHSENELTKLNVANGNKSMTLLQAKYIYHYDLKSLLLILIEQSHKDRRSSYVGDKFRTVPLCRDVFDV